ncbi:MAG: hypothetical protein M3O25_09080 [Actinomycetota bacterium]|nr:hypothetical protein [Actinomycetota bacterium]
MKTPFGELSVPDEAGGAVSSGEGDREVIVGIRPEHLEDAKLIGADARGNGNTFNAKIDLIESPGAEFYAYFHLEGTKVESEHLSEVAADAGLGEIPSAQGGQTAMVARLGEESQIGEHDDAELWLDNRRVQLFDPESGDNLTSGGSGNGAGAVGDRAAEKPVAEQPGETPGA